jgi:PAS domain S-box-containing protein
MVKTLVTTILGLTLLTAGGTTVMFWPLKSAYHGRIEQKLEQATKSLPHILGKEYFDKIKDKNSVSDAEYKNVIARLTTYVNDIGEITYVYGFTIHDDQIVEVASTPSEIDLLQQSLFFSEYQSASPSFVKLLQEGKPSSGGIYRGGDEYGDFVSFLMVYTNSEGRRFVLGADLETSQEKQRLTELFYISLCVALLSTSLFSFVLLRSQKTVIVNISLSIILLGVFIPLLVIVRQENQKMIFDNLFMVARTIPEILGQEYIDRAKSPDAVSPEEFKQMIRRINSFAKDVGITHVFAVRRSQDRIVYIADSTTEEELEQGFYAGYWGEYDTSPTAILPLFEEPDKLGVSYQDEYGSFRSVFFSQFDSEGDVVVFGANRQQNDVIFMEIRGVTSIFLVVLVWGILLKLWSVFYIKKINPREEITEEEFSRSLAWRAAGITSGAIIIFLTIFYIYAQRLLYNSYERLEVNELKKEISRFKFLMEEEKKYISLRFSDWSNWDDAYRFVQDGNSQFSTSNLVTPTLISLNVNLIMYLDINKNLVGGQAYDTVSQKGTPELIDNCLIYLQQHPKLFSFSKPNSRQSNVGIVNLNGAKFLLSVAPVIRSDLSGVPKGFFVIARKIDREFVASLARRQNLSLRIYSLEDAQKIDRFEPIIRSILDNKQDVITAGNTTYKYGYTILNDINNKPAIFVQLANKREIFLAGKDIVDRTLLVSLISFGVIILGTNLTILQFTVLSRLLRVVDQLKQRQENETDRFAPLSISGKDEIAYLTHTFNELLEINRKNNEKFIKIFRSSPVAIMIVRVSDGQILEVNNGFEKLFGYSTTEALSLNIAKLGGWFLGADGDRILSNEGSNDFLQNVEVTIHDRYGKEISCNLSLEIITIDDTPCILYNIADISKLKQLSSSINRLNSLLKAQQETSIEGILATDERGKIVSFNHRLCHMWYLNPETLKDCVIDKLISDGEVAEQLREAIELAYNMESGCYSNEIPLPDGRVFDVRAQAIYSSDKCYFGQIWYFRDISSLVRIEEQLFEQFRKLSEANAEIAKLNERLKAENLRMSAELNLARHLQEMILPKPKDWANLPCLDVAALMEPAKEVGGDYYDVFQTEHSTLIIIGDVTGHGLDSGIVMLMVQTTITTLVELGFQPHQILSTLNWVLYKNLARMQLDKSLTLAILSYEDNKVKIIGQHEDVIILRRNGEIERVDTWELGFPIGLEEDISCYLHYMETELAVGETIILFTDGVTESEDQDRCLYGIDRLCKAALATDYSHKSSQQICDAIVADIRSHIGDREVLDDITLVVIKQKCVCG